MWKMYWNVKIGPGRPEIAQSVQFCPSDFNAKVITKQQLRGQNLDGLQSFWKKNPGIKPYFLSNFAIMTKELQAILGVYLPYLFLGWQRLG